MVSFAVTLRQVGKSMLLVEKIGGSSMSKFDDVLNNIIRNGKTPLTHRVLVVSAYAGVTNWLLEDKKTGAPGVYQKFAAQTDWESCLDGIFTRLVNINQGFQSIGLDLEIADAYITNRIRKTKYVLRSLADVLASGYVNRTEILLAAREVLASVGEAHSAFNSVNILNNQDVPAVFIDLSGFDDSEHLTIDQRVEKVFRNIDFSKGLIVATGYAKGTEGIMREFDRGYSEVTFSKIAVAVRADEAIIHKEFHLSSADPNLVGVENAIPVGQTNYDVADQLADVGMEAIHPKASKPLEQLGIHLRIKNTFDPDHPGTLISKEYMGTEACVEIIASTDRVVVIEVHDSTMVGEVGADLRIMQIFAKYSISYISKATNANSISMVVWEKQVAPELVDELKSRYQVVTVKKVALISVIGSNIAKPGVLAKATQVLAEHKVNVDFVSQSLRQVNMQFVIEREHYRTAVAALNQALCVEDRGRRPA
jgi:aspartate kinase